MEKDTVKITWINDALSVLRNRDRYSQVGMILDFRRIASSGRIYLFNQSILLDKSESLYATSVRQGSYVFFWKWYEAGQRVEIWAVYETMLNSVAEVKRLIEKEGWDNRCD